MLVPIIWKTNPIMELRVVEFMTYVPKEPSELEYLAVDSAVKIIERAHDFRALPIFQSSVKLTPSPNQTGISFSLVFKDCKDILDFVNSLQ